jgi:hypothetical protein
MEQKSARAASRWLRDDEARAEACLEIASISHPPLVVTRIINLFARRRCYKHKHGTWPYLMQAERKIRNNGKKK